MRYLKYIYLLSFFACQLNIKKEPRSVERSLYYWKTAFHLSNYEKDRLNEMKIKTLYIKFFDVMWDKAAMDRALPVAQLYFRDSGYLSKSNYNIIPTIFITNESLVNIDSAKINTLAQNITALTQQIISKNGLKNIVEIQIDCDWTRSTSQKYFALLNILQKLQPTIIFSSTIRLHQIKYANKTGVPPVKRGMLMCYNMGNLTQANTTNSIIDIPTLQSYTSALQNYPLPLDIALPIFDWWVLFNNNQYKGLIQHIEANTLHSTIAVKENNTYKILIDTVLGNYTFKKGDVLRHEESTYNEILIAGKLLSKKISNNKCRVSLYHLDTLTLKKFTKNELENIYNSLY